MRPGRRPTRASSAGRSTRSTACRWIPGRSAGGAGGGHRGGPGAPVRRPGGGRPDDGGAAPRARRGGVRRLSGPAGICRSRPRSGVPRGFRAGARLRQRLRGTGRRRRRSRSGWESLVAPAMAARDGRRPEQRSPRRRNGPSWYGSPPGTGGSRCAPWAAVSKDCAKGLAVVREAGTALEIPHGTPLPETGSPTTPPVIAEARASGVEVTGKGYPCFAGWPRPPSLLPGRTPERGVERMRRRLTAPAGANACSPDCAPLRAGGTGGERTFLSSFRPVKWTVSPSSTSAPWGETSPEETLFDLPLEPEGGAFGSPSATPSRTGGRRRRGPSPTSAPTAAPSPPGFEGPSASRVPAPSVPVPRCRRSRSGKYGPLSP